MKLIRVFFELINSLIIGIFYLGIFLLFSAVLFALLPIVLLIEFITWLNTPSSKSIDDFKA